jgi:Cft2 family RNA processing exonuclease
LDLADLRRDPRSLPGAALLWTLPLSTLPHASNEDLVCLPYGVGHGDEGVCLLIKMGPYRILLDCGLKDISPLITADRLPVCDLVICSNARADRARGLLELHRTVPQLPIYSSEVTSLLLPLNWLDEPEPVQPFGQALPWRRSIEFQDGLTAELFPAGHLPGAAAVLLTYTGFYRSYRVFYTGDFFLSNSRLVDGLHLDSIRNLNPDVLIIEGSYGTARHPHRRKQENTLMARIDRAIERQQSIILPVSSLGIAQELLILLRSHHLFTGRDIDIWVDGKIVACCDAYLELIPHFPPSVQNFARHQSLFWDEKVRPHVRQITPETLANIHQRQCIIVTETDIDLEIYTAGHPFPWLVLLPSAPAETTLLPATTPQITIETYLLSQHSDGAGTTQLIHNIRPKHVVFIHGAAAYLADLTALEELQNRYHLHSPAAGTLVSLPIGDTFIQPAPPADPNYEGELTESEREVNITLPTDLASDPRWHNFADTGSIEARWQGEEIVLRGISGRELLDRQQQLNLPPDLHCCGNCRYQRGSRCYNTRSPLHGFKVTPDGFCPVFESN